MKKKLAILILMSVTLSLASYSQNYKINIAKGKDASSAENYNLAIYYFSLSIEENPEIIDSYNGRAHAYNMTGDYKKAIKDYEYVLNKDKYNTEAYFGLGSINATWLNNQQKAIYYFTKVIDYSLQKGDSDYAGVGYFMRADIKARLNDRQGYIQDLRKGAKLNHNACKNLLELELTNQKF